MDKCTEQTFHDLSGHQVEVKRATPREQSTGPGRQEPRGGGGGRGNRGSYGGGGGGGGGGKLICVVNMVSFISSFR